jgi:hypothetical protein
MKSSSLSLFIALMALSAGCASTSSSAPRVVEDLCTGLDEADLTGDPIDAKDVIEVRPLEASGTHHPVGPRMTGAVVVVRATKGVTEQWLQRLFDCRIARAPRNGSEMLGGDMFALVDNLEDSFSIRLKSSDADIAARILREAQKLQQPEPEPATPATAATRTSQPD